MWWMAILAGIVWFGLALVVVADMFRKNAALGFLGLVLLPVVPFIWVLKWYGGQRWRVGSALYLSAAVAWAAMTMAWDGDVDAVQPFVRAAKQEANLDCEFNATGSGGGHTYHRLLCRSDKVNQIQFSSSEDMAQQYNARIVAPLIALYRKTLTGTNAPHLIVGVLSPGGLVSCHRLDASGVQKVWVTGIEDPCDQ